MITHANKLTEYAYLILQGLGGNTAQRGNYVCPITGTALPVKLIIDTTIEVDLLEIGNTIDELYLLPGSLENLLQCNFDKHATIKFIKNPSGEYFIYLLNVPIKTTYELSTPTDQLPFTSVGIIL